MSYLVTNACMYIEYRALGLVGARAYTASSELGGGGGRVYEIKNLCSNLAPEEGEGRLFEESV